MFPGRKSLRLSGGREFRDTDLRPAPIPSLDGPPRFLPCACVGWLPDRRRNATHAACPAAGPRCPGALDGLDPTSPSRRADPELRTQDLLAPAGPLFR